MITTATRVRTRPDEVFELWCALTGYDPAAFDDLERESFLYRPELPALGAIPDAVLRDAGEAVRRGRSLPLERWLAAVRVVRPVHRAQGRASSA
jgi:hypothetical protein